MEFSGCSLMLFSLLLLVGFASSSSFISGEALESSHGSGGRSLLQVKKSCPVNFESQNYTIITSKCKGPRYPPKECCGALKEFACPFSEELNDGTNDCATTMFSYINIYGKYPPGLFASECREGKEGLECPDNVAESLKTQNSGCSILEISLFATSITAIVLSFSLF